MIDLLIEKSISAITTKNVSFNLLGCKIYNLTDIKILCINHLMIINKAQTTANHRICIIGQATKSVEWMPWHREPMKDVISCEKLR